MQQHLEKIIQKAVEGGWKDAVGFIEFEEYTEKEEPSLGWIKYEVYDTHNLGERRKESLELNSLEELIFDHDFAKAFWSEERIDMRCSYCKENDYLFCVECEDYVTPKNWQYHLQQLATSEDRIGYLMQFV